MKKKTKILDFDTTNLTRLDKSPSSCKNFKANFLPKETQIFITQINMLTMK